MQNLSKTKFLFLSVIAVLFISLMLMLGYFNRFAADDYFFLYQVKTLGVWKAMIYFYNTWNARWAAILTVNFFLGVSDAGGSLLIYHALSVLLLISSVYLFLKHLMIRLYDIKLSVFTLLCYSVLFSASFFFLTFGIEDTWFWLTTSPMYLWGITAAMFGWSSIISKSGNVLHYIVCILAFTYAGASNEPLAIMMLLFLSVTLFSFYLRGRITEIFQIPGFQKTFVSFIVCLASFIAVCIAPGVAARKEVLGHVSFWHAFPVAGISMLKLLFFKTPLKIPFAIFFSLPWIVIGRMVSPAFRFQSSADSVNNEGRNGRVVMRRMVKYSLFIFLVITYLSLLPVAYVMHEMGPERTLAQNSFYLALLCAFLGFMIGKELNLQKKMQNFLFYLGCVGSIWVLLSVCITQYSVASAYASAVDKRIDYLKELNSKGNTSTVELVPLPPSGFLYSSEISEDTTHFLNYHFQKGLFLNFKVKKSSQSSVDNR